MNQSRSNPPRPEQSSSLEALSRTIEGLEARIEGLMSNGQRDTRGHPNPNPARAPAEREPGYGREALGRDHDSPRDPLAEIRERQRMLESIRATQAAAAARASLAARAPAQPATPAYPSPTHSQPAQAAYPQPAHPQAQPHYQQPAHPSAQAPAQPYNPAQAQPALSTMQGEALIREITEALSGLKHDLKAEISDGLAHELGQMRTEMQSLKSFAAGQRSDDGVQEDLARLAERVAAISHSGGAAADGLRDDFEQLRALMDGLAREESLREMETRWTDLEIQMTHFDPGAMREELGRMALRLEDVKQQLSTMSDSRSVRALEDKLIAVATALEQIGARANPSEDAFRDQFAGLDLRLDEITRAIVAGKHTASEQDDGMLLRIDERLSGMALQIESLAHPTDQDVASEELLRRIEMLANRMEELSGAPDIQRLEQRIESLTQIVSDAQPVSMPPEFIDALADLSAKIDGLGGSAVDDGLAMRLDRLARMIEEMEERQQPAFDDTILRRLDDRMAEIAGRLDETMSAPAGDSAALRGLEDQISNLSRLLSENPQGGGEGSPEMNDRVSALEDYMATSDEYIIEAARQAAEAVMANFAHDASRMGSPPSGADLETVAALAQSLRHLESISRDSEERNQRTLDSLKETLLDIADRLDRVHTDSLAAPQGFATAPIERDAAPATAAKAPATADSPAVLADTMEDTLVADRIGGSDELEVEATKAAPKPSLLASLNRKLRPSPKVTAPESADAGPTGLAVSDHPAADHRSSDNLAPERQSIDPSPSIDPVDMVPSEEDNVLLEPGSGAPDVRKILERVRAASNQGELSAKGEGERTDYIAAARRAAQAAAQEAVRTPASGSSKGAKGDGTSLFARYRRPLLMAAGAVLLVLMAMPLVKSLTHGDKAEAPAAPAIAEPADSKASVDATPAVNTTAAPQATADSKVENLDKAPALNLQSSDAAPGFTDAGPLPDALIPASGADGAAMSSQAPNEQAEVASDSDGDLAGDGVSEPAAETAQAETPALRTPPATQDMAAASAPAATDPSLAAISPPSLAKAAQDGDPKAMFEVAARYSEGRGVDINLATAASWYQRAAEKGLAPAEYRLANLYEKGSGVPRDIDKARDYYEKAAIKGNASAMHNLAVLYASGSIGTQNYEKAAEWFEKAAQTGITDSQFNLAILYARGNGVQPDLTDSYKWFSIAANDGDKDAAQKRDELAAKLKPEELKTMKAAVAAWKPTPLDPDANAVDLPDEWVGKSVKTSSVDMTRVVRNVQGILNNNGFDAGAPDGIIGAKTIAAIKAFQTSVGQTPSGRIDDDLVKELLARNK
ncbi:peptidoglycan-binding protein [Rhizobium halophytocola]|uniref:Localization factor PodJL n=1 Tax=Rhizobium halophytocola TaxID=735519 RepID=A0ABS4E0B7_9HYPH|nr:peptidoglycan-binding protein [Rhizobium halophytocola]MBP1851377.1 localization factor PodJL [Rhizobium halophytocola]